MSYFAVFDRIAPAANKYMATLSNANAARKVVVNRIFRLNWQVAAVTGVLLEQELRRISARTVGTNVPIQSEDSADTLSASITADTGSTSVTEVNGELIRRFFAVSEEVVLATAATVITGQAAFVPDGQLVYWRSARSKGIVLRNGQGLTIKNLTSSTVGSVSYVFEFDDGPA